MDDSVGEGIHWTLILMFFAFKRVTKAYWIMRHERDEWKARALTSESELANKRRRTFRFLRDIGMYYENSLADDYDNDHMTHEDYVKFHTTVTRFITPYINSLRKRK